MTLRWNYEDLEKKYLDLNDKVLHIETVRHLSCGQILMAYNELNPKKAKGNKK